MFKESDHIHIIGKIYDYHRLKIKLMTSLNYEFSLKIDISTIYPLYQTLKCAFNIFATRMKNVIVSPNI